MVPVPEWFRVKTLAPLIVERNETVPAPAPVIETVAAFVKVIGNPDAKLIAPLADRTVPCKLIVGEAGSDEVLPICIVPDPETIEGVDPLLIVIGVPLTLLESKRRLIFPVLADVVSTFAPPTIIPAALVAFCNLPVNVIELPEPAV